VKARYSDGWVYVTEARFGVYESGYLTLDGEVGLRDGEYALQGSLRRVLCEEMVPEDWKKRLLGSLESDFTVTGSGREAPVVRGELVMKDGVVTALPVLDRLAAYTDTTRFRRMALNKAQLTYTQTGQRLELRDILLASDGLARVEGSLDIVGNRLDGDIRLGVVPGLLASIPGAETKVFMPGKEGLLWTPVRISGTLEDPDEDLSERMIAAAGERMFEMIPETGALVLKHSGKAAGDMARSILKTLSGGGTGEEGALNPVEEATRRGTDALNGATDLVEEGVGGLFNLIPGGGRDRPAPPREEEEPPEDSEESEDEEE
jgi:hypothetical protein